MAITITGTLIIDETLGKQNATAGGSDITGNDVADGLGFLNTGVTAFDTLLNAVVVQDLSGVNVTVAVSNGTSADPDGSSMLSGFGDDVTDLAFTNSTGGPLLGEEALSAPGVPLLTVDGTKIFLYSYTGADLGIDENNAVFGRKGFWNGSEYVADPSGDVVFAAYLQPTDASGAVQTSDLNAVGSKVWLVQYEEIKHPITTNPDDALSLYNLHVSVSNQSDFSLAGAPSGQNLFLMYGDGTPSPTDAVIIVTGKNPVNQSAPNAPAITAGDTVNTGQGGGPTTLGTNSQQIVEGSGLYFTFAKGANTNFTVPNLDQNEADVEANIDFTSLYGTNGASFSVVQSASGDKSTLEISAYTTPFNPGITFIDNLHTNTAVEVNKVTITTQPTGHGKNAVPGETLVFDKGIIGTTSTTLSGITVTFSGDTVVIKGLEADDLIAYNTDGPHTRTLIDNIGSTDTNFDAPFDIGGFRLVNSNVTPNLFSALTFQDDGPATSANNTVLLDDDALTGGNPGGTDDDADAANTSGTLGHDFGQDGAGTVAYLTSGAPSGFSYVADGTSLLVKQGTTTVLTLTMVAATGAYTVVQNNPILHAAGLNENNQAFTINYRVTDGDGDTADGTLGINVDDDTPVVTAKSSLVYANSSNGASLTDVGGTGVFAYSIGADKHVTPYSAPNSDFLSVALTGVTVGANAITNKSVTWVSENDNQAVFNVGFTYVSNNPAQGATTNATGTLIFDKVADTYTLKLAQEIESFSILNTSTPGNPLKGYALDSATIVGSNPPVSVMTLASDFFVQFEGFGVINGTAQTFAYDTNTGLFSNDRRYVTVSSSSIGAASDTLQSDEVIDLDFFKNNPEGFTNSAVEKATSKAIFIEFTQAGIGAGKDMLVVLKLVDDISGATINRTFIVGNSNGNDDVLNDSVPTYGFVSKAQNGIVVFESNDYNFTGEHFSIQGAQVVTSTQGTSGTGYQLNGAIDNPATPGIEGATPNGQIAFGGATTEGNNEPIKIVNIGFVATSTPDAHLTFDVVLADADGDATATHTLDVTIVGDNRVTASTGADTFVIADSDVDGLLSMVLTVIDGGFVTGTDKLDFTAVGSVTNYTEVLAPATNLATFTAAADIALDGTKDYYFGVVGGDGYLAFDADGNGITTIIQLVGVTNIDSPDIV